MNTIRNTFHNTTAKTRLSYERCCQLAQGAPATPAELRIIKRLKSALCGSPGCKCSDRLGARE